MGPVLSKEFLDNHAIIECEFTLKRVRDMIRTYSQMHRVDKYSQHRLIIWPVWPVWLSFCLQTNWFGVRFPLQSLKLQIWHLSWARSSLIFKQLESVNSLWNAFVTWYEHTDSPKCTQFSKTNKTSFFILLKRFVIFVWMSWCFFKITIFSKNLRSSWFLLKWLDYLIILEYLPGIKKT